MKFLKRLSIFILLSFSLCACSNLKVGTPEWYLKAGMRSLNAKYFEKVLVPEAGATTLQREYAYRYLAIINLNKDNLDGAISIFDKQESESDLCPHRDEVLASYFKRKGDFKRSIAYATKLSQWIDKRILEVEKNDFDIDKLDRNAKAYDSIWSIFDKKESKMLDIREAKELRKSLYLDYLRNWKTGVSKELIDLEKKAKTR